MRRSDAVHGIDGTARTGIPCLEAGMAQRLFVYGTLAPGQPNAHVLADVPGHWEPASVRDHRHALGWGATMGYPGLVLDGRGDVITGLLFTSDELAAHFARLDGFEGEAYERVVTCVTRNDGSTVEAHVYQVRATAAIRVPSTTVDAI